MKYINPMSSERNSILSFHSQTELHMHAPHNNYIYHIIEYQIIEIADS